MSIEYIQTTFTVGELAPRLRGQTDLEQYSLAVEQAENWVVEYRGGISTRPGLEFKSYLMHDDKDIVLIPFRYAPNLANTYQLVFGDGYIRVCQEGEYVLEPSVVVSAVSNTNPAVVTTAAPHGYVTGDWVQVAGLGELDSFHTFSITVLSPTTFSLQTPHGDDVDASEFVVYSGGGTVSRIYTIPSPYTSEMLRDIRWKQLRDTLRLVCGAHEQPIRDLTRLAHDNWELKEVEFAPSVASPSSGLSATASGTGLVELVWTVTSVDADGNESPPQKVEIKSNIVDYTTERGSVVFTWDAVPGAVKYRVYRSILSTNGTLTYSERLGFIGTTSSTRFTDANIVPDFTQSPPTSYSRFVGGQIERIEITSPGTGYGSADTVTISDPTGSGYHPLLEVSADGSILGVFSFWGGKGYTNPTITFNTSTGSGATAQAIVSPSTGIYPQTIATFQQRLVYGATPNQPLTVFGSRVGNFNDFTEKPIVTDDDPWEFTLDHESVTPVLALLELRGGLIVFSRDAIWKMTGGRTKTAVTATSAFADPQSYLGIANLPPLIIDTDVLYLQASEDVVRLLAYNNFSRLYAGTDVSILSSHLVSAHNPIVNWTSAISPYRLVWAVRKDGTALAFTIVPDQKVFGWTPQCTNGKFKFVLGMQEQNVDQVYFVVEREIGGRKVKYLERLADRTTFTSSEDVFCVDSGLRLPQNFPNASLTLELDGDNAVLMADADVFADAQPGWVVRGGGGKFRLKEVVGPREAIAEVRHKPLQVNCVIGKPFVVESGEWTLDRPVATIAGLWHLEGEEVQVLGDGSVMPPKVVQNGRVELEHSVTRCVVGLAYRCTLRPLPPSFPQDVVENKRYLPIELSLRVLDTRGLEVGRNLDSLYELKERTTEMWGEPIGLQNGTFHTVSVGVWGREEMPLIVQRQPLPATIVSLIHTLEYGDANR